MKSEWKPLALILAAGVCTLMLPMLAPAGGDDDTKPNGKASGTLLNPGNGNGGEAKAAARPKSGNGINYHGGPLMVGTVNLYYIWYGTWDQAGVAVKTLTTFGQSLGGSPYYNINTTYYDGSSAHLTNAINLVKSATDNYSQGTSLSDSAIQAVVLSAISSGRLPQDANGVYFVLTSADVTATSGFCTQYCGWHTHTTNGIVHIKYAFVGDPTRCPNACQAQTPGPNGNTGADGMASIIAHETEEAASDPELNAWYDTRGAENADKCAWTFGTTYTTGNGSQANMNLGGLNFLIQRNWVNASGGYCAQKYP
jgi:hypothetical protein